MRSKEEAPKAETPKAPEPIAIRAAAAESRRVERAVFVTGSLHPDETVAVSAEVPGRISSIKADFGQAVRKGDVLAEIDGTEIQLQLDRSRAALAQALARVGLSPAEENATPTTSPTIRQAQALLDDANSKLEAAAKLVKTGDIATERYNELEKAARARQAALDAARDELRTLLANIQALRAEVKLAQKRLGDTVVRAPFDGAVSNRTATAGQFLKENTPILTLVKNNPLRLRAEIPEPATGAARPGTRITFTTDAAPGREFHALVRELNPALDAKTRTLTVEARLIESDPRLRAGVFAQVRLVTERDAAIVVVPRAALYSVAGLTKAFAVRDGVAREIRMAPGLELGDWVEAPAGALAAGETVAVSNLAALTEGTPVKVR